MKTLTIISTLLLFNCGIIQGQTFDEWFRQKKTQKKYLVEQIASLKIFLGNLKKGVDIAYKGWNTISNIKDGNFMLHRDFLSSLKQVNPAIRNSAKVADIITLQFYLLRDLRNLSNYCQYNSNFTPEEARYVALVYTNMTRLCDASLSELLMIIRSDETEMKDDERIKRIDKIYDDTYDKHSFVQVFSNGTRILSSERESEKRDAEVLKRNHEVI